MADSIKIAICVIGICLFCIGFLVFIISLMKAAAPKNSHERFRDDYEQMKALGYFDNVITSGSPAVKE